MTAIMNCPFIPIAARPQSHRGAQGVIYADMLKQSGVDIEINWGGKIEEIDRILKLLHEKNSLT